MSAKGVGICPTRPGICRIAKAVGCHKADVSNYFRKRYDKVGKRRRRMIKDWLVQNGFAKERKHRRMKVKAARRITPAGWA